MRTSAEESPAAGIYVHVPFCSVHCPFCNFAITTALGDRDAWLSALEREIGIRAPEWPERFDTIYLGGGTPSLVPPTGIARLLAGLRTTFDVAPGAEVTLETNPGDVGVRELEALRAAGVNRLSLGIQSLDDGDLRFLGRAHDARAGRETFAAARETGFENITVDLIYGLPLRSRDDWRRQVAEVAALAPDQISAYNLTFEPGTPLTRRREAGEFPIPSDDEECELFLFTRDEIEGRGYRQYEVSSFARDPRFRSAHNRKYWEEISYLGLGPSAHSYRDGRRWWNLPATRQYARAIERGESPVQRAESLSHDQRRLERLFLRLRTTEGLDLDAFERDFGRDLRRTHAAAIEQLVSDDLAVLEEGRLRLGPRGLALADGIAVRLA